MWLQYQCFQIGWFCLPVCPSIFLCPTQMLPVTFDDYYHLMGRYYTSVTGESVNRPERQCYLICFVTSSSCLGRHLHLCICLGAWECQTASAVAALCMPTPPHDFWKQPGQCCFTHEMLGPLSPVRANCQSATAEPWSSDLTAELSWAAHLSSMWE